LTLPESLILGFMHILDRLWGSGGLPQDQQAKPTVTLPFPGARGRAALARTYDLDVVRSAMLDEHHPVTEVDPRRLSATQPSATTSGISHYLSPDYQRTGQTFADTIQGLGHHTAGNRIPVVYQTDDGRESVLMSGHHRAYAALLQGRPLMAKVVTGPYRLGRRPS
jgi:hypothetical protein